MGETEVAAKKSVIPTSPVITESVGRFLPIVNVSARKMGKRIPEITTGPFE
jgi:hypothetical protein